jgi:hypothetical protein
VKQLALGCGFDVGGSLAVGAGVSWYSRLIGRIHPQGAPLKATLDGADCVTYSYEVTEETGTGRGRFTSTHFTGVALARSFVLTPSGNRC